MCEIHGTEWHKRESEASRVTTTVPFNEFLVSLNAWEVDNTPKDGKIKDAPGTAATGKRNHTAQCTWSPSRKSQKLQQNLDGTYGKQTAESFKRSGLRVESVLYHIWEPDVFFKYNSGKNPPMQNGVPLVPRDYVVDEGVTVLGWALPVKYFPPPPTGETHKVIKYFDTGDSLGWERMRSDVETFAQQTEQGFGSMARAQHEAALDGRMEVDQPTKKALTKPRQLSTHFNAVTVQPVSATAATAQDDDEDLGWVNRFRSRTSSTVTKIEDLPHYEPKGGKAAKQRRTSNASNASNASGAGDDGVKIEDDENLTGFNQVIKGLPVPQGGQALTRRTDAIARAVRLAKSARDDADRLLAILQSEQCTSCAESDYKDAQKSLKSANDKKNRQLVMSEVPGCGLLSIMDDGAGQEINTHDEFDTMDAKSQLIAAVGERQMRLDSADDYS